MIIANITTYEGQCLDAEHYYCSHEEVVDDNKPSIQYGGGWSKTDLKRSIITEDEAKKLNIKDNYSGWHVGCETNRFNSIEEIHNKLIELYSDQIIVTYYNGILFKEMLYYKNGINLGYKEFGEIWNYVPNSCYKHLLPEDLNIVKIKCDDCGHEYKLDEVSEENFWDGKILIDFYKKRNINEPCCKYFNLMWNIIL
jgi:hypothetical protein